MSNDNDRSSGSSGSLRRQLGFGAAVAFTVGNIVGAGVFLMPRVVAGASPNVWIYIGLWVVGGLVAMAGALAAAELGSLFPRAGGDYVFLHEAFGSPVAYAWGWLAVAITFSGSVAVLAVGTVDTILGMSPFGGEVAPLLEIGPAFIRVSALGGEPTHLPVVGWVTVTWGQAIAVGLIWLLTLLHCRSVSLVSGLQSFLIWTPVAVVLAAGVWILVGGAGSPVAAAAAPLEPAQLSAGLLSGAFAAVFFTYSGWNVLTYVGGEVKDPGRTIPKAILTALTITIVLYVALNAVFLRAFSVEQIAQEGNLGVSVAGRAFGTLGADIFAVLMACAITAGLSATAMAGSRIAVAMARDGYLWQPMARLHPRLATPVTALLFQAVWATILVFSGRFEDLVNFTGVAMFLLSSVNIATLFVFRRRGMKAEYRALGYPWTPAFFIAVAVAILIMGLTTRWWKLLIGLAAFGLLAAKDHFFGRGRKN